MELQWPKDISWEIKSKTFLPHKVDQFGTQRCRLPQHCQLPHHLEFPTLCRRLDRQCLLRSPRRGIGTVVGRIGESEYRNSAEPVNYNNNSNKNSSSRQCKRQTAIHLITKLQPAHKKLILEQERDFSTYHVSDLAAVGTEVFVVVAVALITISLLLKMRQDTQ